jgi:hypothetical protein
MPTIPFRRVRRLPNEQKLQEDRSVRQSEATYRNRGYSDASAEQEAQIDFDLAQQLKGKKRGLRNVKLSGPMN